MVLHALMDVLDAAGGDEAALEVALRELATGLTDDDINGLGNMDPDATFRRTAPTDWPAAQRRAGGARCAAQIRHDIR